MTGLVRHLHALMREVCHATPHGLRSQGSTWDMIHAKGRAT